MRGFLCTHNYLTYLFGDMYYDLYFCHKQK